MFVVPVKYLPEKPYIQALVKSIRSFHPEELILICDSQSANKEYIEEVSQYRNVLISFNNKNYVDSAIWTAYNLFPKEEFFYILHDSTLVTASLEHLKENDFTNLMYFPMCWDSDRQKDYVRTELETKTKYRFDDNCLGLFGITFYCKRWVLDRLKAGGLDKVLPTEKVFMCAQERSWAMCLSQEGIDYVSNSLMGNYFSRKSDSPIQKFFVERQ